MNGNEHRSPSTYSSSTSPSSNGHPSSSNTSPSPPRSSASPPDELVLLSLANGGSGDGEEKEGRQHRTVPCKQCRSIRRVCRWVEGRKECERCLKRGFACSGPQRRGKATLTPFIEALSPTASMEEELDLVAIGPSSSTEGWNRTHMSYALTHHLVETCLKLSHAMTFPGVDVKDFQARFDREKGRTSELSLNYELLSLVYVGLGAQLTDHTAILGAIPTGEQSQHGMLGLVRRAPLLDIVDQIGERLEDQQQYELDTASAIDRLGLAWMALEQLHMPDHGLVRHRLLGSIVRRGMDLAERPDLAEGLRGMAKAYLQGLAREEIRQSLESGLPSSLSPSQHHIIFGPPAPPPTPSLPDDSAVDHLFMSDKASEPVCIAFYQTFFDCLEQVYDHLDYVLTYAPRDKLQAAVLYVWRRLDDLAPFYSQVFERINDDPRYAEPTSSPPSVRPGAFLNMVVQFRTYQLSNLWACHLALARTDKSGDLLSSSEQRIFEELSRTAREAALLPSFPKMEIGRYLTAIRFTLVVDLFRETLLLPWAEANPEERDLLVIGLKEASDGLPEAARLVQLLEAPRSSESSPPNL